MMSGYDRSSYSQAAWPCAAALGSLGGATTRMDNPTPQSPTESSPEDRARLQHAFKPVARRWRRHTRFCAYGFVFFICTFITGKLAGSNSPWLVGVGVVSVFLAVGAGCTTPGLTCPGCRSRLDGMPSRHCPECGHTPLDPYGSDGTLCCPACRKRLRIGFGRSFKIRVCGQCGLHLDERGL